MGIRSFKNQVSAEIAQGLDNKRTRTLVQLELHRVAPKKAQVLRAAKQLDDLRDFPGLQLEKLKGARRDEYSIRVSDQYRICFKWESGSAVDVAIEDYHR
jgi:toxin HigB-1